MIDKLKKYMPNLKKNENAKAASAYFLGNIFYKAFPLLMMPILTGMLSTNDYGIANTYAAWVSIITCLNGFGMGNAIRAASVDYKEDFNKYLSSVLSMSFLQFLIVTIIGLGVCTLFFKDIPIVLALFCSIQSFMTCVVNAYIQKYMMNLQYIKKMMLQMLPNVIIGLLSVVFIYFSNDDKYMGRILAFVVVYVLLGLWLIIKTFLSGRVFFNKQYWLYGIHFSLPLVFSGLALVILSSFDTTMLTSMVSASESGIYSVAYSVGTAVLVITSSLESVWIPWFTKKIEEKKYSEINKGFKGYLRFGTLLMTGAMLCLPEIFTLFANKNYWPGKILIPPIVLATFFIFLYSIAVNYEYYAKKTKVVATNSIIAAVVNIILNAIIIPKYGAQGAAYTTVASYVLCFLLHTIYVKRIDNFIFPIKEYIVPLIIIIAGTILSYLFMDLWIIRWIIAAILVFCFGILTLFRYGKVFD